MVFLHGLPGVSPKSLNERRREPRNDLGAPTWPEGGFDQGGIGMPRKVLLVDELRAVL
jgi:hypothetical protein